MKNTMWYAVMRDNDDTDWGTGSNNMDEAIEMAKKYRADGYEDAYIAVIDDEGDPICLARAWAKKTWERQSAKGSCRVELCEIDTQLHATDLAYALHNTDSKISMLAQVIERWER